MTNSAVEQFPKTAEDKAKPQAFLWDGEVKGFGMRWSARSDTRTYFIQYRVKGSKQERQITIGRHGDPWKVDQARAKAIEIKAQMLSGLDAVEEEAKRQEAKRQQEVVDTAQSATLRQVMDHYLTHRMTKHAPLREATKQSIKDKIEGYLSEWLDKPMAAQSREMRASCARYASFAAYWRLAPDRSVVVSRDTAALVHNEHQQLNRELAVFPCQA